MSHPQSDDLIDSLLGLNPDGTTWQARRFREKARQGTQDSYDTLFSTGLSLALDARWLVALYASRLSKAPELSTHYLAQAQAHGADAERIHQIESGAVDAVQDGPLQAMLLFTKKLIENPIEGDQAALLELKAAGLSTPEVVTLAQLVAFLSYQTRLVAGLRALRDAEAQA